MAGKWPSGGMQMAMRFSRGQALVPQVDRQVKGSAQLLGKSVRFGSLGAEISGHIERIAQNDGRTVEFAQEAAKRLEVQFRVLSDEGQDRLGGQTQFVGHRNPDATVTEIKAEQAGFHNKSIVDGAARRRSAGHRRAWAMRPGTKAGNRKREMVNGKGEAGSVAQPENVQWPRFDNQSEFGRTMWRSRTESSSKTRRRQAESPHLTIS
jgi:hypothetical protein